jgi:hydroxymethylpyrimidine/phosphomethylpyrimidine kinase
MICAVTVAGSDSSSGAGLQADLNTFWKFGIHGLSVVTSVTAQNSRGIQGIQTLSRKWIRIQMESVMEDFDVRGIKTGMLGSSGTVRELIRCLSTKPVPTVILDPVLRAKDGTALLDAAGVDVLKHGLFPMADCITPNIPEASVLWGHRIRSLQDVKNAAVFLQRLGCGSVLIKGGHSRKDACDVFFDGKDFREWRALREPGPAVHGTGCVLSAAILSERIKGRSWEDSISLSKTFITEAIRKSWSLGRGWRYMPFSFSRSPSGKEDQ